MQKLRFALGLGAVGLIAAWLLANGTDDAQHRSGGRDTFLWAMSKHASSAALRPLPKTVELDADKINLGKKLFHDTRLSGDGTVACASCHDVDRGGVDGLPTSIGIYGQDTGVNAPSVLNSGFNTAQFWNGRAPTLEAQAGGPIEAAGEMGSSLAAVVRMLNADADYRRAFDGLYPDGVTAKNIREAIATFERSLITPNAPFDRYLRGETEAISQGARAGYELFVSYGCSSCHQGINVGGNLYQRLGIVVPYYSDARGFDGTDLGRFNVTGREEDRFVFKVPSLRNVTVTDPYFHDGSIELLVEVIRIMGRHQLGRVLSDDDVNLIAEFLDTLTGQSNGS